MKNYRIIFCIPGNNFSGKFLDSFLELIVYCMSNGIHFSFSRQESPVIYYVRNMCLGADVLRGENQKPFNGQVEYTHLMWIDSDIIFKPQHFQKLLDHDKDVVSGIYMMGNQIHFATVEKWDEEYFKKNGAFQFWTNEDIKNKEGLIEVAYCGFGFVLIKKGVFEKITYPWFRPIFYKIDKAYDFCSEDTAICKLIQEAGFKIYVDPKLRVLHEKKTTL
jgi:hypothetical protein